jgi:hypothetical protein
MDTQQTEIMNSRNCQQMKHRPRVKQLRAKLATVIRQIRQLRRQPKFDSRKFFSDAVRRGLSSELPPV